MAWGLSRCLLKLLRQAPKGEGYAARLKNGARYRDKRPVARKMWDTIMRALETVKAVPKRAHAA
jgi:hypothetical protein